MTTQTFYTAFRAMGSQWQIWLETAHDGAAILRDVPAWVEAVEAELSRFRPESALSDLNRRSGEWVAASETLLEAVQAAKHAARLTNGRYNPLVLPALVAAGYDRSFDELPPADATGTTAAVPATPDWPTNTDWRAIHIDRARQAVYLPAGGQIDLGGMGKGWTAERVAERLTAHGACLVDAGGDLVARGAPQHQTGWRVTVAEPAAPADTATADALHVVLRDAAIATSGSDYRRWQHNGATRHHLIDPLTGQPAASDAQTVTVIHSDAVTAEAYAKALFLQGSEAGLRWLNQQWHAAGMVIRQDGAILATRNFEQYVIQ